MSAACVATRVFFSTNANLTLLSDYLYGAHRARVEPTTSETASRNRWRRREPNVLCPGIHRTSTKPNSNSSPFLRIANPRLPSNCRSHARADPTLATLGPWSGVNTRVLHRSKLIAAIPKGKSQASSIANACKSLMVKRHGKTGKLSIATHMFCRSCVRLLVSDNQTRAKRWYVFFFLTAATSGAPVSAGRSGTSPQT